MQNNLIKPNNLKRVGIIGSSCVGKTTFAKNLAQILNVKHIEMDAINWLPEWKQRTTEELRELTEKETSAEKWVLDGNYSRTRDIVWTRATHIIWLSYPLPLVFYRAVKRTTRRAFTREEICGGNHENFRQAFFSKDSMIIWALRTFHSRRRRYNKQVKENQYENLRFLVFQNPKETKNFLEKIKNDLTQS